jgi:hypothetical protein
MMAPRKGFRRFRRRKEPRDARARDSAARKRLEELTERTRQESRELARHRRAKGARRLVKAQGQGLDDLRVRARGTALETRRRTRPMLSPFERLLSGIAPYISGALLLVVKLLAALVALLLEVTRVAVAWIAQRTDTGAVATARALARIVTPMNTVAFVGAAAAILLGVSQFFDYHGVVVDADAYAGKVGSVAPAPITGTGIAGSAHLWVLIPVAIGALALVIATYRGRPDLAWGVAICGLLGVAVSLAIDLPQGLDAGRPGLSFSGSDAVLLGGFWAQLSASGALILCGGLFALYSRGVTGTTTQSSGEAANRGGRRRRSHPEVGGASPGLQAGS